MFDIGFFELLVIAVVLLFVIGPDRLPDVAKQIAFFVRKARQSIYRFRTEMQSEMEGTPFADLETAKREIADLKNDLKQFGRDLAESADTAKTQIEQKVDEVKELVEAEIALESDEQRDDPKKKATAAKSVKAKSTNAKPTKAKTKSKTKAKAVEPESESEAADKTQSNR